jgi:hypothetical protein
LQPSTPCSNATLLLNLITACAHKAGSRAAKYALIFSATLVVKPESAEIVGIKIFLNETHLSLSSPFLQQRGFLRRMISAYLVAYKKPRSAEP